jgi:hypothetical protein
MASVSPVRPGVGAREKRGYHARRDSQKEPAVMTLDANLKGRLRIPVIGAPLFIVSGPELVIAQCKAGIVGSFAGAKDPAMV